MTDDYDPDDVPPGVCERCGYPEESFACKARHISMQTGWAKAAND